MLIRGAAALSRDAGDTDHGLGKRVLALALEAPLRQLAAKAGLDPSVALRRARAAEPGFGLDLRRNAIVDLRAAGVVDAADVVHSAVEVAVSIARTSLLTETIVAQRQLPALRKRPYGHHHGHGHGHFGGLVPANHHAHHDLLTEAART
jgi:chaperonin GroEL